MSATNTPSFEGTLTEALEGAARVDALNELARAACESQKGRAYALASEGCALARTLAYDRGLAESLMLRARAALALSSYTTAQEDVREALTLFERLGDASSVAGAANLLGMTLGDQGYLAEALAVFLANRQRYKALSDTLGEANALNNAALVFTYLSDYPSALDAYRQALELFEVLALPLEIARTFENIGLAYLEMGNFGEALGYFERSLTTDTNTDREGYGTTLMNIGRVYEGLGDLEQALTYSLKSVDYARSHGDDSSLGYALDSLGSVHFKLGHFAEAQHYIESALTQKRQGHDRLGEAKTLRLLGQFLNARLEWAAALAAFHRACDIADEVGSKAEVYKAHLALAEAYENGGGSARALKHYRAFIAVRDEVFSEASDRKLQALRVAYEVEHKEREKEIYRLKNIELAKANEELEQAKAALEKQAREDALTGLYNRRYLDSHFAREFERAWRYRTPLSVAICDIDNFKTINDTLSHSMGDEVLVKVAAIFREHVRKVDTVARYGGEEFVVLMPQALAGEAVHLCERLRVLVASYPWHRVHPQLSVTISMGVSSNLEVPGHEKMLAEADLNLYQAKRSGKNRVCS